MRNEYCQAHRAEKPSEELLFLREMEVAVGAAEISAANAEAVDAHVSNIEGPAADAARFAVFTALAANANVAYSAAIASAFTAELAANLGGAVRESIRHDFELLKALAESESWTDHTPVRPDVFDPMVPGHRQ